MKRVLVSCLVAALFSAAGVAQADTHITTLAPNSGWQGFSFDSFVSDRWLDDASVTQAISFDFTLTSAAVLHVTEAGFGGNQFRVFANGQSLGFTSASAASTGWDLNGNPNGTLYYDRNATDYAAAFADANGYAKGSFTLSAGTYHLTGTFDASLPTSIGAGFGAVELVSAPVPEPQTYAMLLAGLGLMAVVARRRMH